MWVDALLTIALCVLTVWTIVQTRRLRREMRKFREQMLQSGREQKLLSAYANIEDLFDAFEQFVRETRGELDRDRREIQEYARQAMAIYVRVLEKEPTAEAAPEPPAAVVMQAPQAAAPAANGTAAKASASSQLSAEDRESLRRFSNKNQKIRFLLSRGLSQADTAKELDIGVGEVRLVAATIGNDPS